MVQETLGSWLVGLAYAAKQFSETYLFLLSDLTKPHHLVVIQTKAYLASISFRRSISWGVSLACKCHAIGAHDSPLTQGLVGFPDFLMLGRRDPKAEG